MPREFSGTVRNRGNKAVLTWPEIGMTAGAISATIARMLVSDQAHVTDPKVPPATPPATPPGVARRLAGALYDLMLVLGVVVVAAALATLIFQAWLGIDLTRGLARSLFQLYLLAIWVLYYLYFWSGGRQSLGMRAWRLRLERADGHALGWGDAARRLAFALLSTTPAGLGLWWVWFDHARLSWYDRLSGTRLRLLPKPPMRRH